MPIKLTVKVTKVDHYGFVGREHHPTDDMVGHYATVLNIHMLDEKGAGVSDPLNIVGIDSTQLLQVFDCVLDDGRIVTLMDFEVMAVAVSDCSPLPTGPTVRAYATAWFEGRWGRHPETEMGW